ncbi:tetratricopeptide repeat protein [Alcaligenes faecalis]|uniref:O-linked N-acetylglucosamine transferase, SPINDLY family protein n=1 Tax=Alcaligenes faecalis TaxID=511 RepID=UPI0013DD8E48|nr:tetratricopeptide repeat protein [Alcaligenes faecalis]
MNETSAPYHAMSSFDRSVSPDTRYQDALQLFNGSQFSAAIPVLEALLAQHPEHQASLSLIIKALINEKRPQDARGYLPRLKLTKDLSARALAVDVYVACRDYAAAQTLLEGEIKQKPSAVAWFKLAELHAKRGDLEGSRKLLRQAHRQDPKNALILGKVITDEHFNPNLDLAAIAQLQQDWQKRFAYPLRAAADTRRLPGRTLRIGLLSDGFSNHPVIRMTSGSLTHLPKKEFKLYAYSSTDRPDDLTAQFREQCHAWREIAALSDDQLNEQIRRDRIDILIDMSGYHKGTRLRMLSMKPAPLIVKWVGGLNNSMGLDYIDYLISDRFESPEGTDSDYTEKLIRMPNGYISYTPPFYVPEVGPAPLSENGYVTFGCFNNANKINAPTIQAWAAILKAVPDARLLLKGSLYEGQEFKQRIKDGFQAQDIDPERLDFEGQSNHRELLRTYNRVDITLDPWPFSGGLTTLESMLMGVPVITLPGPTFASRHSTSHISNAGYPQLVAQSWDHYVSLACLLAQDHALLASLRSEMRQVFLNSPVCDHASFAQSLRQGLRAIWQRHCDGVAPAALGIQADHQVRFEDQESASLAVPLPKANDDQDFNFELKSPVVLIDHGARLLQDAKFEQLYATGALHVICFDPAATTQDLLIPLNRNRLQIVQQAVLGHGGAVRFRARIDNQQSGTLPPVLNASQELAQFDLPSIRLDDLDRDAPIDWLMLADNYDNHALLSNAAHTLEQALAVSIKVHFAPGDAQQLDLSQARDLLAPHGLEFYTLMAFDCESGYTDEQLKESHSGSRIHSALALFLPRNTQDLPLERLEKLAFILHAYFGAHDYAQRLLTQHQHPKAEQYLRQARLRNLPSMTIPDIPAMTAAEIEFFESCLDQAQHYYEFGSGGSTKLAASMGLNVHGVESDRRWLEQLHAEVGEACKVNHVDIGPTKEWGYPVDLRAADQFPNYSRSIHTQDLPFDLILVDGRFRVASTLESIDYVLEKGDRASARIFIHDFWNRAFYKPVLEFLDAEQTVETAGLFKIKANINRERLQAVKTAFQQDYR